MIHELKTDPIPFPQSWNGDKLFEVRRDDRNYNLGDVLILKETKYSGEAMSRGADLLYTGRQLTRIVTCKVCGVGYGIESGWCILGARKV